MKKIAPFLVVFFLASCGGNTELEPVDRDAPAMYVVNYPLAFFAETIAGDQSPVKIFFPEMAGDPAFWKPSDVEVSAFQKASVILRNGATYAKWAEKVSLPESTQRDTSKAFAGDYITILEATTHSHGDGEVHAHKGYAFTTWLDLQQAIWQAEEVRDALIELSPADETGITERFNALADDLDLMHAELRELGKELEGQPLIGSHPVYQYLARRYKLNMREVHWEPDIVPDESAMDELKTKLEGHEAKVMVWEDTPHPESVKKLNQMGIRSIVFNPAGNRPDNGDFMSVMRSNITNMKGLLEEGVR